MNKSRLTICFLPGRESSYVRTRVLLRGLREAGLEVIDCSYPKKNVMRYVIGFYRFLRFKSSSDVILVGFYGQFLVPLVRLFTRKPIIFDTFLSTYQTLVFDRGVIGPESIPARVIRFFEQWACRCADVCLLDTEQHIQYFKRHYDMPTVKFKRSWLGAEPPEPAAFKPDDGKPSNPSAQFVVHFHGEFQALHGIKYIIEAARLLPDVTFRLIGGGRLWKESCALAQNCHLTNIEFIPPVPFDRIPVYMSRADVCLGIFGDTEKTNLVIPFKVYEALALGKPIITADTPAIRELLTHNYDVFLCPPAEPALLAEAICTLKNDPARRVSIGQNGQKTFLNHCTPEIIGLHIKEIARGLC